MDNFDDYYNRFIAATYGVNILNYTFFLSVFFVIILIGVVLTLIGFKATSTADQNDDINDNRYGYSQSTDY